MSKTCTIGRLGISALLLAAVGSLVFSSQLHAETATGSQTITGGALSMDYVDSSNNSITSPSLLFSNHSFSYSCTPVAYGPIASINATGQKLQIDNPTANSSVSVSTGLTSSPDTWSATVAGTTYRMDANDNGVLEPTSGNVAHYRLDEGSGQIVSDTSGTGNNGVLGGTSTIESVDPTWISNGRLGSALNFDGNNDHVKIPPTASLKYQGGDFTLSTWIKPNATETSGFIFFKPWNGVGKYNYTLRYVNNGLKFNLEGATGYGITASSSLPEAWSHVTATVNEKGLMKIYVNGLEKASGTHTITSWEPSGGDNNVSLALGAQYPYGAAWGGNSHQAFLGSLDDMRIYNTALSASQVATLAAGGNGCQADGGDTDTAGGNLLAEPTGLGGTMVAGCTAIPTYTPTAVNTLLVEDATTSASLLTIGNAQSCRINLTGGLLQQAIPGGQTPGTYTIGLTFTAV